MTAIIKLSGKQYKVELNSIIYSEKIHGELGKKVIFNNILMLDGIFDREILKKYKISGIIEKHSKQKKIIVFRYKPKKNTKRKLGHRQNFTQIRITDIPKIND